ncbi:hypothetical protein V2S66_18805 [Streptomyces sp. V4-01]|uniref:Uncharacterized protein n=1 Tax=Actinacidiphila polyblastidii TaxID=3110430 RepID=A0ABU7PDX1_9ACTN|nr:hypothetical protein [Streptomyces sp. V4-01]
MPQRTPSLFHPRRTLQFGGGMSVRMDRATDTDLLAWSLLSRRYSSRTGLADNDVLDYIDQRIDAFRDHPGIVLLGDLERTVFGYADDPDQPIDAEPDEEQPNRPPHQPHAAEDHRIGEPQ